MCYNEKCNKEVCWDIWRGSRRLGTAETDFAEEAALQGGGFPNCPYQCKFFGRTARHAGKKEGERMSEMENHAETAGDGRAKLDALMKKFLSNRKFLALLLKHFVGEFRECSLADIGNKYIEPESIRSGEVPVERDFTNRQESIEGIANEDTTLTEGRITYDVIFIVRLPGKEGQRAGMYINCEAQAEYYPGYPLETRGFFYAARRFSSQLKAISRETDYGKLRKVYSIWLVVGDKVPRQAAGTATLYHTVKEDIIGTIEQDASIYDKMSVVMLRFRDDTEMGHPVMRALQALFSNKAGKEERLSSLRAVGVQTDEELAREVEHMCNYSEYVERKGKEEGLKEGKEEGLKEGKEEGLKEGKEKGLKEGMALMLRAVERLRQGAKPEDVARTEGIELETVLRLV